MEIEEVLKRLEEHGCHARAVGEQLRVKGPLTDALRALIREHKAALIAALQRELIDPFNPQAEGKKARELLDQNGWCAVRSHALDGETVIWSLDGKVLIPARWRDNVRYTIAELAALVAEPRVTAEGLRRIHEAKKLFSGTVTREGETP